MAEVIAHSYAAAGADPEEWVDKVRRSLRDQISAHIVRPLIAKLDAPLQRQAYSIIDSLYAAETELVAAVAGELAEHLPDVLARHLARRDDQMVQEALVAFLTIEHTCTMLAGFFDSFVSADAFLEFRDIETYANITDGVTLYLYLGALRFRSLNYPLFFLPVQVDKLPDGSGYNLTIFNQLFANRAAIDFVLQEMAAAKTREWASPITERINYLQPSQSVYEVARGLFGLVANAVDLPGQAALGASQPEASTADVSLSSALHLCAFEKGAEALVNDYEALIDMARREGGAVVTLFEDLVKGVLTENPKSIRNVVENEWEEMGLVDRMVFDSPIALNEEQRRILLAVRHPEGRIVVVSGPPGTGKSHTITAIAADCAFNRRSCLILSDKAEALQVVQDKLSEAMNRVRADDNFPNPLLRLGRQDANFKRLVGTQTINQVSAAVRAMRANEKALELERVSTAHIMRSAIQRTATVLGSIELQQVQAMHERECRLEQLVPQVLPVIQGLQADTALLDRLAQGAADLAAVGAYLATAPGQPTQDVDGQRRRARLDQVVAEFGRTHAAARDAMLAFERLDAAQVRELGACVLQYRQLRMPLFGYLFRGAAVSAIEAKINMLPVRQVVMLRQEAARLELVVKGASDLKAKLAQAGMESELPDAYSRVVADEADGALATRALAALDLLALHPELSKILKGDAERIGLTLQYAYDWLSLSKAFRDAPEFDYVGAKTKLERINTSRMNAHVDSRLVDFVEEHRADARTLAQLIAQRQKFPAEKFEAVRSSFPVIIAGIREFGEYMPLVPDLFDVVVIDEASQVSVAQALPAILRAKKVVVLGDTKQFANVKSSNASIAVNDKYRANLVHFFERTVRQDAAALQRLAMFDVKKSILEFCSISASYTIMLCKHFRSFPELIGYSSKYFYNRELQAIRVRGLPLEQVIRFDHVDAASHGATRTTNPAEADRIVKRLEELLRQEHPPTVAVITPFREQHKLLTTRLFAHPRASEFEDRLKLRVFTFDTCQGEERGVIFYSMVATAGQDALAYVFPPALVPGQEDVEDKLKVQRLNVGFSRAQDTIWIVHSMPLASFRGAIGQALNHYAQVLTHRHGSAAETDAASPMEAKVLHWLHSTRFVQEQPDNVEIVPQFKLGEYLKQLDPNYDHPAYRVDFLVTYHGPKGAVQIVIEYDGWEHHFQKGKEIHVGNHQRYLTDADVERQLTLESYGYRFIRLNRFNVGADPVALLDTQLARLVEVATGEPRARSVERMLEQTEKLAAGESRPCTHCGEIKPREDYYDPSLRSGEGGYGRKCMQCKGGRSRTANSRATTTQASFRY